jgi:hypothetical protein
MQWFQCRSCRRSTPLSRVSGWVQQWSAGHVSYFCAHCRDVPAAQTAQSSPVRREYYVDGHGLVRTRPVRATAS